MVRSCGVVRGFGWLEVVRCGSGLCGNGAAKAVCLEVSWNVF